MAERAIVLFGHGSVDPRWAEPLQALATRLRNAGNGAPVAVAYLERLAPDLPSACAALVAEGIEGLQIVPVFLGQGGHVREDLPRLVDALRVRHPGIDVRLSAAVGEDAGVLDAIAAYCRREAIG